MELKIQYTVPIQENPSKLETLFILQNPQDIKKGGILELFHPQNIINMQNYILNVKKLKNKHSQMSCACKVNSVYNFSGFPVQGLQHRKIFFPVFFTNWCLYNSNFH